MKRGRKVITRLPAMEDDNFKAVFMQNYMPVVRYLSNLTGEAAAAEDLAQEAFVRLYYQAPVDLINARAWLYRVATNLGYNYLRREKNRNRQEVSLVQLSSLAVLTGEDLALRSLERISVQESLSSLSERDRTCLLMKFSGHSYKEIAEVLGIERSSVGTILVRAQDRFRREFERREGQS